MKQGKGMSGVSGIPAPPAPEKVFDTADTNKDGVVAKDELASVIGQGGCNTNKRPQDNASGTDTTASSIQDFQSKMLNTLLEKLASFTNSSVKSTPASLYA